MTRLLVAVLCAIPIALVAWLGHGFYVELPFMDAWYFLDFFEKVHAGRARLADWLAPHELNGHPVAVPRLLLTLLAFATGWSIRAEALASLVAAVLTFVWIVRLARRHARAPDGLPVAAAHVLTAWTLFGLSQYWNWIWGFSFLLFWIHLAFMSGVLLLDGPGHLWTRMAGAAACCVLASLSMHHGLLAWFALLPSVAAAGRDARRTGAALAVWSAATAVGSLLVVSGVSEAGGRFGEVLARDPLRIPWHFLNVLGIPAFFFARWSDGGALDNLGYWPAGALLLAAFLALAVRQLSHADPAARRAAVPWISLGTFSVAYAAANTLGRIDLLDTGTPGFGMYFAIYTTPPVLLWVAVVQLAMQWVERRLPAESSSRPRRARRIAVAVVASPFALLTALNTAVVLREVAPLRAASADFAASRCFDFVDHLEGSNTCWMRWLATPERIAALERLGFRTFVHDAAFVPEPRRSHGRIEEVRAGGEPVLLHGFLDLREWQRRGDPRARHSIVVAGSVGFPDRAEPPATVLLARAGSWRFFAWARVEAESDASGRHRWRAVVPGALARSRIRAWVWDPERRAFVRLEGEGEPASVRLGGEGEPRPARPAP